jgi:hypothetical protein
MSSGLLASPPSSSTSLSLSPARLLKESCDIRERRGERVLDPPDPEPPEEDAVRCFCGDAGAETSRCLIAGRGVVGRWFGERSGSREESWSSRSVSEPDWWSCVRARRREGRLALVLEAELDFECEEEECEEVEWVEVEPEAEDEATREDGAGGWGERVALAGRVLGEGELRRENEESLSSACGHRPGCAQEGKKHPGGVKKVDDVCALNVVICAGGCADESRWMM